MSATIRSAIAVTATGELGWSSPFGQVISSLQTVAQVSELVVGDGSSNVQLVFPNMTAVNTLWLYALHGGFSVRFTTNGNSPFLKLNAGGIYGFANANHDFATYGTGYVSYTATPTPGVPGKLFIAVAGT